MRNHTYRRLRVRLAVSALLHRVVSPLHRSRISLQVGNIQPNNYQQPHGGYFMSIELRYHPLIPNRTCESWDCPAFEDITFEDVRATGAARAGDINGFKGDLLRGLRFRNVSFATPPKQARHSTA